MLFFEYNCSNFSGVCRILAFVSNIFLKSFTLTFLAEWGDRSQITTIILGAREVSYILFFY